MIGIIGAFTAGGIVIGSATLYAASLGGGNAAYGMLFIAVFVGLAIGMGAAPRMSRRMPHNRLFGTAIVAAGCALVLVALAPHLYVAIAAVGLVGGFAGIAFLTGLTIIGAQVADEVRGRIVAFVQSIVRLTLLGSMALVPLLVGLVSARTVDLFGYPYRIDGTRVVMLVGGVIAAVVGMFAYRQMDDRRTEPLLPDLLAALRRGVRRGGSGVLIAIEGRHGAETAEQAQRLVERAARARAHGWSWPVPASCGPSRSPPSGSLAGPRARRAGGGRGARRPGRAGRPARARGRRGRGGGPVPRQPAGAARGDGRPDAGRAGRRRAGEPRRLRDRAAAAGRLGAARPRPAPADADLPAGDDTIPIPLPGEEHLRVRRLLTRMAAAEPHRYVVVEADGTPDEVARRVLAALTPVLPTPPVSRGGPEGTTGSSTPPSTTIPSTIHSPAPVTAAACRHGTPTVGRASTDPGLHRRARPRPPAARLRTARLRTPHPRGAAPSPPSSTTARSPPAVRNPHRCGSGTGGGDHDGLGRGRRPARRRRRALGRRRRPVGDDARVAVHRPARLRPVGRRPRLRRRPAVPPARLRGVRLLPHRDGAARTPTSARSSRRACRSA